LLNAESFAERLLLNLQAFVCNAGFIAIMKAAEYAPDLNRVLGNIGLLQACKGLVQPSVFF